MKKRIISTILVLVMLFSLAAPNQAIFAAESDMDIVNLDVA